MLAPHAFPDWLPPAVSEEVKRILSILNSEGIDGEALVLRLATDQRMKSVWAILKKHKKDGPRELSKWAKFTRDVATVPPPESSDPLVLFFYCACMIACMQPSTGPVSKYELALLEYQVEAMRLRYSATKLQELNLRYSWVYSENGFQACLNNIEKADKFCDVIAKMFAKMKDAHTPLVIERNFGSREARGYVRMLAVETRNLFGQRLGGTLATVASVALGKKIEATQVNNWARR